MTNHGERERNISFKFSLQGIQALRGLAALMVVIHHALEESNGSAGKFSPDFLTTAGAAGVDVFFVISGFIMFYTSFCRGGDIPSSREFLLRRALRIYPLYWLCCFAMLGLAAVGFLRSRSFEMGDVAKALLLLPSKSVIIGVSWTLVFEMYFYLIFAVTLLFQRPAISLIGTTAAILVLHFASPAMPAGPLRELLANPIAFEFCFGLGLGWLFRGGLLNITPWSGLAALAAFQLAPLIVAHQTTAGLPSSARVVAWGLPAALLVASVLGTDPKANRFTQFAERLGGSSYALYLSHPFLMLAYAAAIKRSLLLAHLPQAPIVVAVTLGAIALALLLNDKVELPLERRARRILLN